MNKALIIIGILILLVAGFFAYRAFIPPSFSLESFDNITKSGSFMFSGNLNTFNTSGGGSASGYSGWVVTYGNKNGVYSFDLYHNGQFVKNLKTI